MILIPNSTFAWLVMIRKVQKINRTRTPTRSLSVTTKCHADRKGLRGKREAELATSRRSEDADEDE